MQDRERDRLTDGRARPVMWPNNAITIMHHQKFYATTLLLKPVSPTPSPLPNTKLTWNSFPWHKIFQQRLVNSLVFPRWLSNCRHIQVFHWQVVIQSQTVLTSSGATTNRGKGWPGHVTPLTDIFRVGWRPPPNFFSQQELKLVTKHNDIGTTGVHSTA